MVNVFEQQNFYFGLENNSFAVGTRYTNFIKAFWCFLDEGFLEFKKYPFFCLLGRKEISNWTK